MSWLCKVFNHSIKHDEGRGINPRTMQTIFRKVKYCTRGDYREKIDVVEGNYDVKIGGVYRGSGGPCEDCINAPECDAYKNKSMNLSFRNCPIHNFSSTEEVKKIWANWGDTLIGC